VRDDRTPYSARSSDVRCAVNNEWDWFSETAAIAPASFAALCGNLDAAWIEEALSLVGSATLRRRKLPVDRAVWLVIGMALFRDRSIAEVASHLELALPNGERGGVSAGAIPAARERLGSAPLQRLFDLTARHWAVLPSQEEAWRGLALYSADGSCLCIPDTDANEAEFGRPGSSRSTAGYPQVRIVALLSLRNRILAGLACSAYHTSELHLAKALWPTVPDNSLTILDRGYISYWLFDTLRSANGFENRHWLVRKSASFTGRTLETFARGDELVEFEPSTSVRRRIPELPDVMRMRQITFQKAGYRPTVLLTSLLDPKKYPAKEIAALYHERWEIELAYDELKTDLLGRLESLRSKSPEGVRQEVAGIGIAYNLVRVEMARVAADERVSPNRISFRHALQLIRNFCVTAWMTPAGALPRRLGSMEQDMRLLILPERRAERRYPRQVKVKMSKFKRNHGRKPSDSSK
jgi:hypothetical protein